MDKVVERVKENNPDWFEMHKEVFFETTDYMFELTYDEDTFSKLFYEAFGFMGRKKSILTKIKPVELTKSMNEKIKANLGLSNKVGKLLRRDGEYGTIIASKEHIYVNGMNIRALLDDFGSVILTKVIGENLRIYDLCNSIETSHRSKRVLRIIERGVARTKDYNVGVMFKASELLMCIVYRYNMIENRGRLKNVWETPINAHDIVLYAPM